MKKIESKRIGNLEFRKASYLLPEDEWPENPAYDIIYWYPNCYYKRENEFIKDGDWYLYPDNPYSRVHKDCFKNEQSCFSIAFFNIDSEGTYELRFVGDRPLNITLEERDIFWKLIKYGYEKLNSKDEED